MKVAVTISGESLLHDPAGSKRFVHGRDLRGKFFHELSIASIVSRLHRDGLFPYIFVLFLQSGMIFLEVFLKFVFISFFCCRQVLVILTRHRAKNGYEVASDVVLHQAVHHHNLFDGLHVVLL